MHDEDAGLGFWEQLHQRLFRNCEDVWEVVRGVLCIDSPEGRGSEEDEMDGLDIGTKEKLSFSWRALKESRLVSSPECLPNLLLTRLCSQFVMSCNACESCLWPARSKGGSSA